MSLLGLDLNASRVRAVRGPLGEYPNAEHLEPPRQELPLVLSLESRSPRIGSAGLRICRKSPQLIWQNFLPQIPETPANGTATHARSAITAGAAISLAFQHVMTSCHEADGVAMVLPAYLSDPQIEVVQILADRAGMPLLGSICAPLAVALAGYAEQTWYGAVIVLDVDDHALTIATIGSNEGQAQLLDVTFLPHLNERVWRERLVNALADSFILDSRWDPRESPVAEQSLFDQLDDLLDATAHGRTMKMTVQAPGRFQSLVVQPHEVAGFCSALRRHACGELESVFSAPWPEGAPAVVLMTHAAGRLPGLAGALQTWVPQWRPSNTRKPKTKISALEDFGAGLLDGESSEVGAVVLTEGAAARGAHCVAALFQRGDLAWGHLETSAPLPLPMPLEAGPARLHFQGHDYLLESSSFAMGRHPGADLVFDGELWPGVSARHCDIVYDHRMHMLCDCSREGTLVNDRPAQKAVPLRAGDWIRLGPEGPLLRFLGQTVQMKTTA